MKFTVDVNYNDLVNLEDLHRTIPICIKHKKAITKDNNKFTERELMTMYYVCGECRKIYNNKIKSLAKVESQLWKQYENRK